MSKVAGKTKMKKVNYSFGHGTGTVLLSMRAKKLFFCYNGSDRAELHETYGGKQYYSSRSGASGAGFLLPEENDLVEITGTYRASITHLSEAWPQEMFSIKIMVAVEGISTMAPAVVAKDGELFFLTSTEEVINVLMGNLPEANHPFTYRFLSGIHGIECNFTINWGGDYMGSTRIGKSNNERPSSLPYNFEEFIEVMGVEPEVNFLEMEDSISFIERKLNIKNSGLGKIKTGYFGLPTEKIEGELFSQDNLRNFHGWQTQGFGPYKFAYKRVGGGNKIYAMIEAVPAEINEKYSLLGATPMEYELVIENVLEWFNQPLEYWVEKMKGELLKKIRNEFISTSRWSVTEAKAKVRELLQSCVAGTVFLIQDSLDTGNCAPGTESFMANYGLVEGLTCQQIFEHKRFEEMLDNGRFRAVVINKLFLKEDIEASESENTSEAEVSSTGPRRRVGYGGTGRRIANDY